MAQKDFYHYTSERGKNDILASGQINKTTNVKHMWFGPGTYGTSIPPSAGRDVIAQNNWAGAGDAQTNRGLVDWAIRVRLPAAEVQECPSNRKILKHEGPIILHNYDCETYKVAP